MRNVNQDWMLTNKEFRGVAAFHLLLLVRH